MKHYLKLFLVPIVFILVILIIHVITHFYNLQLHNLGVYPLTLNGFVGIFTFPLIHGSWEHILSNTSALVVLLFMLFYLYSSVAQVVFIVSYLLPGLFTWFIGRESFHIGASGIVFSLVSFLFFIGIFSRNKQALASSLIVSLYYGGFIWGIFPQQKNVSWETHLGGFISGLFLAYFFKNFTFRVYQAKKEILYSNQSSTSVGYSYEYIPKKKSRKNTGL